MKRKLKIIATENTRETKVIEIDERGVAQELRNLAAIRFEIDARKPETEILTAELELSIGRIEVDTEKYKIVCSNREGKIKTIAKIIYEDGTEEDYVS